MDETELLSRGTLKTAQLERHLLPRLDAKVLLVSDSNAAYQAFSRKHGIAHQAVNARAGQPVRHSVAGAIHVQNVIAYHQRLRQWLARFHGVLRATCRITWAGIGDSMKMEALLPSNC